MYDQSYNATSPRPGYPCSADVQPARERSDDSVIHRLELLEKELTCHRELMETLRSALGPVLRPELVGTQGQNGPVNPKPAMPACGVSQHVANLIDGVSEMNSDVRTLINRLGL